MSRVHVPHTHTNAKMIYFLTFLSVRVSIDFSFSFYCSLFNFFFCFCLPISSSAFVVERFEKKINYN